jgi:hypothetical protein
MISCVIWQVIKISAHHFVKVTFGIIFYLKEKAFPHKIVAIVIQAICPFQLREIDQFENTEAKTRNVVTPSKSFLLMLPKRRECKGTCEFCFCKVNMLTIIFQVPLQASKVD